MKYYISALLGILLSFNVGATGDPESSADPLEVRFYKNSKQLWDYNFQQQLREQTAWQFFVAEHDNWFVYFNEKNHLPHRAFGQPIAVSGFDAMERADNFIENQLTSFNIPGDELVVVSAPSTKKHEYVNYKQFHQGLEVVNSRMVVKLSGSNVIMFGADVYNDIELDITPQISGEAAISIASADMYDEITSTEVDNNLKIVAVPANKTSEYVLIYDVLVKTLSTTGIPSHYQTFVDAHSGNIIYRSNLVAHHKNCPKDEGEKKHVCAMGMMQIDGQLTAEVHTTNPYGETSIQGLPNVEITVGGNTYYTDSDGNIDIPETGPANASIPLKGTWSTIKTNNVTPSMSVTLMEGMNEVSYNNDANIKELSAYRSVNIVHDHMKFWMPNFTGMDFSLETNIDVAGECNAFYDGTINFFDLGGGCNATSLIADVVYHEYGHGINSTYYQSQGSNFINGAMGEGYADYWGISIADTPIVGAGFYTDSEDGIRRYDIDPKVYPVDLVGQVHADGEIIMGAWYDTHLLMGADWDMTMELFVATYAGLQATTFNGNEGEAFTDVLLDLLQEDDDDGNLINGTPNGIAIVEGFDIHGISLISNATLNHTPLEFANSGSDIEVNASIILEFPFSQYLNGGILFYSINNEGTWSETELVNTSGNNYTANIPAQEEGTLIKYFMGLEDIYENLTSVKPIGAQLDDPNLPYYILVGVNEQWKHDCDTQEDFGFWQTGVAGDLATTGQWSLETPIGSFGTPGDQSTVVAPFVDHTSGLDGQFCFITGQSSSSDAGIGENDVDGGHTTLRSASRDISEFTNPIIAYWRWYVNAPPSGANPGTDWWQVMISDNGGDDWVYVENTRTQDISWRRNAFRVADYVDITDDFKIQMIASDSTFIGQNLDGGSLIEAGIDDLFLYEQGTVSVEEISLSEVMNVYPNPASDLINIELNGLFNEKLNLKLSDLTGRVVYELSNHKLVGDQNKIQLEVNHLTPGLYMLNAVAGDLEMVQKITIKN